MRVRYEPLSMEVVMGRCTKAKALAFRSVHELETLKAYGLSVKPTMLRIPCADALRGSRCFLWRE